MSFQLQIGRAGRCEDADEVARDGKMLPLLAGAGVVPAALFGGWVVGAVALLASGFLVWRQQQSEDVTDERRHAVTSPASEELHRVIVESLHEGVLLADLDGRVIAANRAAAEISGVLQDALLGSAPCHDWPAIDEDGIPIPTEDRAPRVALRTGEVRGGTVGLTRPDGELRWLAVNATPVENDDGVVRSVVTTFADITEQRSADMRLREMERMYRSLVEGLPAVTYIAEVGGNAAWHYASPQADSILGVSAERLVATPGTWAGLVHPDDIDRAVAAERQAVEAGEPLYVEYRLRRPDGRTIHVQDRAVILRGPDDSPPRLQGVILDVTERRAAELSADRRARAQAAVAEVSQLVIAGEPLDGVLERAVSSACGALDVDLADVLELSPNGRDLILRAGSGWGPGLVGVARLSGDDAWQPELVLASADPVFVRDVADDPRFQARPLLADHGVVSGVYLRIPGPAGPFGALGLHSRTPRDFTADDVNFMRSLANVLASAVARDHNLGVARQLAQMQRLETVGQVAGAVAHDFNNLLAVILGSIEFVLGDSGLAEQSREDLAEVKAAAESAAALTRRLLTFSRADVEPRAVSVNQVIEDTVGLIRRAVGEAVRVTTDLAADPAVTNVDPTQLEQVLMNLAVNARDAMPNGGELRLTTATVDVDRDRSLAHGALPRGLYIHMTVEDSGAGMDPAVANRAFEPFFSTKGHRGTGLGLATVLGVVARAAGAIDIEAAPGVGTRVSVYWPVRAECVPPAEARTVAPSGSGGRILLVEDEDGIRLMTARILNQAGFTVTTAASGPEALRALSTLAEVPDLVLTDVVMPELRGPELVQAIRATHSGLPVLYMSGCAEDGIDLGDGRTGFISKPFSADGLLAKLHTLLAPPEAKAAV